MNGSRLILGLIILSSHILGTRKDLSMKSLKKYKVTYRSRYYPFEGDHYMTVYAESKRDARYKCLERLCTDEYKVVRSEEVK